MSDIRIRDLYVGKPDAKDELNFEGVEKFIKSFVVAEHFNLDLLLKGNSCFITGFKGTGKTALLFYLEDRLRAMDESTCTSYIFFKEDFTDARRNELNNLSHRVMSSISIEQGALMDIEEFEYIWRWIFFKQLVSDNETYSRNLFVDNEDWKNFESVVNQIIDPKNKRKFAIADKIKLAVPYKDPGTMSEVSPELEVDFAKTKSDEYGQFVNLVDKAEDLLSSVQRTDIPYYMFVDELEAYYGDTQVFKRDLSMIRDLIFTVKRINSIFASAGMNAIKIVCSVRSEIINAITRFVVTKEVNKVITGFSVPLNWSYSNDNSYAHPIIQILLKRISIGEGTDKTDVELYRRWFPEKIHDAEPASYILNNSWYKPRDMIRLLTCAQSCMHNDSTTFSQRIFDSLAKAYSDDSLGEIREELRALYTSEEIDTVISCFTGFQTTFSIAELQKRIDRFYKGTILDTNLVQVLNDLYRLGFIGNYLPASRAYHWQHRGDSQLIMSDEWRICVHCALHSALALGSRMNYGIKLGTLPQVGDAELGTITSVKGDFANVSFDSRGKSYRGQIHISEYGKMFGRYIDDLSEVAQVGGSVRVVLKEYNESYKSWKLSLAEIVE